MPAVAELRARLSAGESLVGTFLKLPTMETIDLASAAGFDLAVVDLEHSQLDEGTARGLVRYGHAVGYPVVVRLPEVDRGLVNRFLEAGAHGVQLSTLRSAAQRQALVDATRYPPEGRRSVSLAHAVGDYGAKGLGPYLDEQRGGPLLVGQIETADEDDPLEEVLKGLDVAFVGTADLSVDMGLPGAPDDPSVVARIGRIGAAAASVGAILGGWVASPEGVGTLARLGARYVLVGSDLQLLREALDGVPGRIRSLLT